MKKIILVGVIAFAIGAIISPIAGMAINSTRSLILGMVPDEAILVLADKIDSNNVENENKIAELQSTIDNQNTEIANYQQQVETLNTNITEAKVELQSTNTAIKTTNETIAKQKDCSADVNKYCVSESFRDAGEFKNFLKAYEDFDNYNDYKDKFTKQFNNCQNALKCE